MRGEVSGLEVGVPSGGVLRSATAPVPTAWRTLLPADLRLPVRDAALDLLENGLRAFIPMLRRPEVRWHALRGSQDGLHTNLMTGG